MLQHLSLNQKRFPESTLMWLVTINTKLLRYLLHGLVIEYLPSRVSSNGKEVIELHDRHRETLQSVKLFNTNVIFLFCQHPLHYFSRW